MCEVCRILRTFFERKVTSAGHTVRVPDPCPHALERKILLNSVNNGL